MQDKRIRRTMKKFFIITSVLFGILLFFFAIYNIFFANNPLSGKVPNVTVVPNNAEPFASDPAKEKKLGPITVFIDSETRNPVTDAKTDTLLFLDLEEGSLKEASIGTGAVWTVIYIPFAPKGIVWSPDMSQALVKRSDTEWALLMRKEKQVVMLKPGIESPAWTSLGDRIVYKYFDESTKKRTLNISSPDGSEWKVIGDAAFQFLEMQSIPGSSSIAFWNQGNAFERTSLRIIPVTGGDPKEVFSLFFGVDYLVSPDGSKFLLSRLVQRGGTGISLGTISRDGGSYRNLSIPTLAGKAVWSQNSRIIYYAIPGGVSSGAILPNDYYRSPILTTDTFWKMDTETGEASRIVDTGNIEQGYDAESFSLDANETALFFRNRRDGKVYRIGL